MSQPLLILGASVRAAAFSAQRAGFRPYCGDRFADLDLVRSGAEAMRVERYPAGLAAIANLAPPSPWMYTGSLENHPGLVDRIAADRPLLGNRGDVLRAVRNPWLVAQVLREAGIAYPALAPCPEGLPADGTWLRKPLAASGGIGIRPWCGPLPNDKAASRRFFQARIAGLSCSAVYAAARGEAVLLGATEQLVGAPWTGAAGFRYAGSIGPLPLDDAIRAQFERAGRALSTAFGLVGLFGVDAVVSERTVWPIEVNPRYTASVEVLERALRIAAVALHVDACCRGELPSGPVRPAKIVCGKAIVYARADLTVTEAFERFAETRMRGPAWPDVADVPAAGTSIRAGLPVTSVFAHGKSRSDVVDALRRGVREIEALLAVAKP